MLTLGRLAMRLIITGILLAGGVPAFADDPNLSVSLALVNLKAEFQKAKAERQADFAPSTDKAVMRKQLDELFALSTPYGQKALQLAEENIRDPASLDALTWIVSGPFGYTEKCGPIIDAAYELLARAIQRR